MYQQVRVVGNNSENTHETAVKDVIFSFIAGFQRPLYLLTKASND